MAAFIAFIMRVLGVTKTQAKGILVAAGVAIVTFHIAWVCGFLGFLGLPAPFARSADLKQLTAIVGKLATKESAVVSSIKASRKDELEQAIFTTVQAKCKSKTDLEKQEFYADKLERLVIRYERLTNSEPRIPSCSQV